MPSYLKPKEPGKKMLCRGAELDELILSTARHVADLVGATLGPSGCPVLIERQDVGLPSLITKDGVTVARNISFQDPIRQEIMSAMRDASTRTVADAGDGTTTATVLSYAILAETHRYCSQHPTEPPQFVARKLVAAFDGWMLPLIEKWRKTADMLTPEGRTFCRAVASVSANGDNELAAAVVDAFDKVGDEGNATIVEQTGKSRVEVTKLEGYPFSIGWADTLGQFFPMYLNDEVAQRCVLDRPLVVLYNGLIQDELVYRDLMVKIGEEWEAGGQHKDVLLVAMGFSQSVIGALGMNFQSPSTINVLPFALPRGATASYQLDLLKDIAAMTRAKIFDPVSTPLTTATLDDLGQAIGVFEAQKYRSNLIVREPPELELSDRIQSLKEQHAGDVSIYEKADLEERIAKLSGGIARLTIYAPSNGEAKERRDRAEDAVLAVRGALKHGVLPGGGWTLAMLAMEAAALANKDPVMSVFANALWAPLYKMWHNAGMNAEEISGLRFDMAENYSFADECDWHTHDLLEGKSVVAFGPVLDSVPAVRDALKNAISIASLLGTLGGVIVYPRDHATDFAEADENREFMRQSSVSEADSRP